MICGLEGRFERHLRNVRLIIGSRPGVRDRDLSALSMLISQRGVTFFTDTYVTVDPTVEEIAEMTILAAEEIRRFGIKPRRHYFPLRFRLTRFTKRPQNARSGAIAESPRARPGMRWRNARRLGNIRTPA
jgi:hypothetical protein